MLITPNNFLRWFNSEIDPSLGPLPNAYWRDRESCGYAPIALPTEAMGFYINTANGFDFPDFDQYFLGMYRADDNSQVANSLGPLQKHDLGNGRFNIFATFVNPPATFGLHYFRIYNNSTSEILLTSSYVLVRTDQAELLKTTLYARFRHDRFFNNVRYGTLPGFYQQFRLNMSVIDEQPEVEAEVYKSVTNGKTRTFESYDNLYRVIESYYFDPEAHKAALIMTRHSFLEFNGKRCSYKSAYKIITDVKSKISKGTFEVYDDEFASVNRC